MVQPVINVWSESTEDGDWIGSPGFRGDKPSWPLAGFTTAGASAGMTMVTAGMVM